MSVTAMAQDPNCSKPPVQLFVCGIAARGDGIPARCCWVNGATRRGQRDAISGSSKIEAEWEAVWSGLHHVGRRRTVEIGCTSPYVVAQFNGQCPFSGRRALSLYARVNRLIRERELNVTVGWLPPEQNLAAKRLR